MADRFEIRHRLGKGGMGVVYLARDNRRGIDVALKTLRRLDAGAIFRFKKEFRALADVSHPNLISLYELVAPDGEQWFFTMELIDGIDWVSWVRDEDVHGPPTQTKTSVELAKLSKEPEETVATQVAVGSTTNPEQAFSNVQVERPPVDLDWERLRDALRQLARGVRALHASGHMHRDIKPSNVMVTPEGRAVLLDFGVIAELNSQVSKEGKVEVVGTPAYMAPEQFRGECVPASDWYSVGVMLYDALTGRRPFARSEDSAMTPPNAEPPPPRLKRPDVPEDLDRLCIDLLRLDPDKRPSDDEVLERLGVEEIITSPPVALGSEETLLVGREEQLTELHAAYREVREGEGAAVYVEGNSGMGKTSLIRRFLDEIGTDDDVVILEGRCYERESVPYKAVDSIVDALMRHLLDMKEAEAEKLIPAGIRTLARVFPVLRRVEAVAHAPPVTDSVPDPQELRRRAFSALHELLARLAKRSPLVLFIDDLQWGDADSAPLLEMLTREGQMPPLLFLASYRREDEERSELLRELFRRDRGASRLAVDALSEKDAARLAEELLPDTAERSTMAHTLASESAGNPYFVQELARYLESETGPRDAAPTLSRVIRARVARLPGAAQRLIEVVAVAGRPITQGVAQEAAGLEMIARLDLVQLLRAAQLIRSSGGRDTDVIECYHDRIRETLVGALTEDELRTHHGRLAVAIESHDDSDAEALATHYRAAGNDDAAAKYVIEAARQAGDALAFDRAAELYELALALQAVSVSERPQLLQQLGEALVNAGRGGEAGQCFLEASADTEGAESIELRGRAAEQFLRAGYIDEGMTALRNTLAEVGVGVPKSPMRAVPALLWGRLRLRLRWRGLEYAERDESEIPRAELQRSDLLFGATVGLALVDPVTAGAFGGKMVREALDLGEPMRVARALAVNAGFASAEGVKSTRAVKRVLAAAAAAAERSGDPRTMALCEAMHAFAASQQGRMSETLRLADLAEARLRAECSGVAWELHSMQLCSLSALLYLGEFGEMARRTPPLVEEAQRAGDLFASTNLRALLLPAACVASDDPQGARRALEQASAVLSDRGFYFHHACALFMNAQIDLYVGDGRRAWKRCLEGEKPLKRSLLLFVQLMRGNWRAIKGMSALAAVVAGEPNIPALHRVALREARRLGREKADWCIAHGSLLRATVAAQRGQRDKALQLLDRATEEFYRAEWFLKATICRRRKGELIGGEEGQALLDEASAWAAEHGVSNLDAVSECFAPGFAAPKQLGSGSKPAE